MNEPERHLPYSLPDLSNDRDAQAAMAGYVYQFELTALRWFGLKGDEVLQPEGGEDIALWTDVAGGRTSISAVLEQIKKRARSITLQSPDAKASLANCLAHRLSNPHLDLRFRFVTNARIGKERLSGKVSRVPGITLWTCLGAGHEIETLSDLRACLRPGKKPKGVSSEDWSAWNEFATRSTDVELSAFVHRFEWSCADERNDHAREQLLQSVIDMGAATDRSVAEQRVAIVLHYIADTVARPGRRFLRRDDLVELLRRVSAAEAAPHTFALYGVHRALERVEARIATLARFKLPSQGGDQPSPVAAVFCEPPELGTRAVSRDLEPTLQQVLEEHRWLHIHGSPGTGKTVLAAALARAMGGSKWISVPDVDGDASLAATIYAASTLDLCQGELVAIDNIPMIQSSPAKNALRRLLGAIVRCDARLITTGVSEAPTIAIDILSARNHDSPPLTQGEIARLLQANAPPPSVDTDRLAEFLATHTRGYAALVAAAIEHLRGCQWGPSHQELRDLLDGGYAHDTQRRALLALRDKLPSPARSLLARMSVGILSIERRDVVALAQLAPAVEEPSLALASMEGAWIVRERLNHWSITPFARVLPSDLPPSLRQACHRALADGLAQRRLDLLTARVLHHHYCESGTTGEALRLHFAVLSELVQRDDASREMVDLWLEVPLLPPAVTRRGVATSNALFLEASDFTLRRRYRTEKQGTSARARELAAQVLRDGVEGAGDYEMRAYAGCCVVMMLTAEIRALNDNAGDLAEAVLLLQTCRRYVDDLPIYPPANEIYGIAFWHIGSMITTETCRDSWLACAAEGGARSANTVASAPLAATFAVEVVNDLWRPFAERASSQADWKRCLLGLEAFEMSVAKAHMELLGAAALRARMIVLGEYLDDGPSAVNVGTQAFSAVSSNDARFLIAECLARQLTQLRKYAEARPWFERALSLRTPDTHSSLATGVLVHAAHNASHLDQSSAKSLLLDALARVDNDPTTSWSWRMRVLGELSVCHYRLDEPVACLTRLVEMANHLLANMRMCDWGAFVVVATELAGIVRAAAECGTADPSRVEQGCFLYGPENQKAEPQPGHLSALCSFISSAAHWLGDAQQARDWALRALEVVIADPRLASVPVERRFATFLLGPLAYLANEDLPEAITIAAGTIGHLGSGTLEGATYVATSILLPGLISWACRSIHGDTHSSDDERALVTACRAVGSDTGFAVFSTVAAVLEECFGREHDVGELRQRSRAAAANANDVIGGVFLFGCLLDKDLPPKVAVECFIALIACSRPRQQLLNGGAMVEPLKMYWRSRLQNEPFKFRIPSESLRGLGDIACAQGVVGLRRLISTIAVAVGLSLPTSVDEVLR